MRWPFFRKREVELSLPDSASEEAAEELLAMDEAIEAIAELPGLDTFRETKRLPAGFMQLAHAALEAYDRYTAVVLKHGRSGQPLPITCTKGCAGCCHESPTGVHILSHVVAYRAIRALPDYERLHNLACDRAEALNEQVRKLAPGREAFKTDDPVFLRAQLAYRDTRTPCAFLDPEEATCRIYQARPIPCRMHFAITPPELCWPGHPKARKAQTPNLPPPAAIVDNIKEVGRRMGLDHLSPVFFPGFVQLAALLEHAALEEEPPRERLGRRGRK